MTASSYDAVILGSNLTGLLTGALLSRRGYRVLVLGQHQAASTYDVGGYTLPRERTPFLAAHCPVARRTMSELALHQLLRRKAVATDPAFQVALPGVRFDMAADAELLDAEIVREFGDVRRPVADALRTVTHVGERLDALFERELVWPPQTFFERREFARATAHQGFRERSGDWDPLDELPRGHLFRRVMQLPASLSTGLDPAQLDGQATCRVFEAWWKGSAHIEGGLSWLEEALREKIISHSGSVQERDAAERVLVRGGRVAGVQLHDTEEDIGADYIVAAGTISELLQLVPDRGVFEPLFERRGEPQPRWFRFTLNVVVSAGCVPEGMARDVFAALSDDASQAPLYISVDPIEDGRQLLCVQTLIARRDVEERGERLATERERILSELARLIPFLREGGRLLLVDSPHDGRDAYDPVRGESIPSAAPWDRGPATMTTLYGYPVRSGLGFCGLPTRTPIKNLLLAGPHNVPALGMEGSFLAAQTAARVVGRRGRARSLRSRAWIKTEL
jgi:phytoene dehydrogenase-like protein